MTQLAREEMFPPRHGYEAWVTRVFDILLRKDKTSFRYNPVLIDGDETRRWHVIVEVLAHLAAADAPTRFTSLQVIAPNFVAMCGASPPIEQHITALQGDVMLAQLLSWPSAETWDSSDIVLPRFEAFFSRIANFS